MSGRRRAVVGGDPGEARGHADEGGEERVEARDMEAAVLITRHDEPSVASTLISLNDCGHDLRGIVGELTRWGAL